MAQSYYVIELTFKWLVVLLLGLAVLIILAFAGGYGAAWSVFRADHAEVVATPTPGISSVEVPKDTGPEVVLSEATPVALKPTLVPHRESQTQARQPASGQAPTPTAETRSEPTPVPVRKAETKETVAARAGESAKKNTPLMFWVQVLASRHIGAIEKARKRLVEAGFPNDHHRVIESRVAGGGVLLKLRVGPFPDHRSADRVRNRLQKQKFPDAWVVSP